MTRPEWGWLLACALALSPLAAHAAAPPQAAEQAQALLSQGTELDNRGDHDGAIAVYGQAIALGAEYEGRIDRSVAYANSGHFTEAFQDLDRAQSLKPADSSPLSARYWFDFELYQFPQVVATIDHMASLRPADPYAPLLRFIASARLGRDTGPALATSLTAQTQNQWPQAAAQMFLRKVSPDQLLEWVEASGNGQAACEAPFYVGEYYLIHNRPQLAQAAFNETERDECRPLMEYYAARGELSSLNNQVQ